MLCARVGDDPRHGCHAPGGAGRAELLVAHVFAHCRSRRGIGTERCTVHHDPLRRVGKARLRDHLLLAQGGKPAQVCRCRTAFDSAEHFRHCQEEHVARIVQLAHGEKLPPHRQHQPPCAPENARALVTQVLAIAHAALGKGKSLMRGHAAQGIALHGLRQARHRIGPDGLGALRGTRCGADGEIERARVFIERDAFKLQLFGAAVAELGHIFGQRRGEGGPGDRGSISRFQCSQQGVISAHRVAHGADHLRRAGRDDIALADQHVVMDLQPLGTAPAFEQLARGPEGYHAEKIVDDRRVPAVEQVALDGAIFLRQRGERHGGELLGLRRAERPVEPLAKGGGGAFQLARLAQQAQPGAGKPRIFAPARAACQLVSPGDAGGERFGQWFAHAHHRFHVRGVETIARQQCQRAIPVAQIVEHAPVDPRQHVLEHRAIGRERALIDPQQRQEAGVDPRIGIGGKGIGERRDHAGIAFDNVGIVEHGHATVGQLHIAQARGDRAGLQQIELAPCQRPLDVLRATCFAFHARGQRGHGDDFPCIQQGRVAFASQHRAISPPDPPAGPVNLTRNQPVRQAMGGGNDQGVAPARHRIGGEGDAGLFGWHHALDHHGGRLRIAAKAALLAVLAQAQASARGQHLRHGCCKAACRYVEKAFVLACVAMLGAVLLQGRREHCIGAGAKPSRFLFQHVLRRSRWPGDDEKRRDIVLQRNQPSQSARLASGQGIVCCLCHRHDHGSTCWMKGANPAAT